MKLTTFTVEPLKGALPITFDMNRNEIEVLLGPPLRARTESSGDTTLRYKLANIGISKADNKVYHVGMMPGIKLLFGDKDLFTEPDPVAYLCKRDPEPLEWVGFVFFLSLGISVAGFNDGDESQRAINVFRKGKWDGQKGEMKPYRHRR